MTTLKKSRKLSGQTDLQPPIMACIDMGTNSFHMIVCKASPRRDHFEIITRVKEPVPFFRRALSAHSIDAGAVASAMRILKDMQAKALQKGARRIVAVATSAVRESDNGEQVLARIRQELALDARMISGKEEARLIYLGVLWSMPEIAGTFGIIDIGGGSTEIIVADRRATQFSESYKLGAARLTQKFFRKDKPTPQEMRELHDEVKGMLRPAAARLAESDGIETMIGTSGTVQALAKLDMALHGPKAAELHGYRLLLPNLEAIVDHIEKESMDGNVLDHVSSDRSRTILAGSVVLLECMRSLGRDEIIVCTAALREGVVVDQLLQEGWLEAGLVEHLAPRARSVHKLLEKYQSAADHASHVASLAIQLFELTRDLGLHGHGDEAVHLLWSAAMLHDIGMFIGRNGHHKHSFYLIRNGGLLGHSEQEVSLIANIARYHRGSEPKSSHEPFQKLPDEHKKMVADLSAMVRLAEALDRSHRQVVRKVELDLAPPRSKEDRRAATLLMFVGQGESWEPETWALKEKKAMFERQFNLRLALEVRVDPRGGLRR